MPSLTIRSFAELLNLPAHAQARILTEQKYPKQGPQSFKTPYYQQAISGIRSFYKFGSNSSQLALAVARIEAFKQEAKRDNNLRVLNSFRLSDLAKRKLAIATTKHLSFKTDDIVLRFSPDLNGEENGTERFLLLHYRANTLSPDLARTTLELTHWALESAGTPISTKQLEYIDLFTGNTYSISKRRASTITAAQQNLKIIQTLWPTL
jgi:hypothetical protein